MPRNTHPITGVLHYFRTAPIEAAEQGLYMAREVLRERRAEVPAPVRRRRKKKEPQAVQAAPAPTPTKRTPRPPKPQQAETAPARPGLPQD